MTWPRFNPMLWRPMYSYRIFYQSVFRLKLYLATFSMIITKKVRNLMMESIVTISCSTPVLVVAIEILLDVYSPPLPSNIPCTWPYVQQCISSFLVKSIGFLLLQLSFGMHDALHMEPNATHSLPIS